MEHEPPLPPPNEEEGAKILPFERPKTPLDESIRRHPAHGNESPQETGERLGWGEETAGTVRPNPDDPSTA